MTPTADDGAAAAAAGCAPSEVALSSVLREFARTMLTDFPIQAILDRLVTRIVDVLPVTGAGVTLIDADGRPRDAAASDPFALELVRLQSTVGEGPCLRAHATGRPVLVPDLVHDRSFAAFGPPAVASGLAAVFTFPLNDGSERLGALDLYRDEPGALGPAAADAAETLADVTAAYLLNARSRAELRAASEQARMLAMHDPLTGLANRVLLLERLDQAVARGARSSKVAAVLYADLDDFKAVNDEHGHLAGDELLVQVAERLRRAVRPGDTLARISGDEFVVLCEDLEAPDEADEIAQRLVAAVRDPFALRHATVELGVSVGIAASSPGGSASMQLLERADRAMYQAKRGGGGSALGAVGTIPGSSGCHPAT